MTTFTKEQKLILLTYSAYIAGSLLLLAYITSEGPLSYILAFSSALFCIALLIRLNRKIDKSPNPVHIQGLWYLLQISFMFVLLSRLYLHVPLLEVIGFAYSILMFLRIKPIGIPPELKEDCEEQICHTAGKAKIHLLNQEDWHIVVAKNPQLILDLITTSPALSLVVQKELKKPTLSVTTNDLQQHAEVLSNSLETHFSL